MSDERPGVYQDAETGLWVFRFSSMGACEKALVAYGLGYYASAPPDWMLEKYEEGSNAEATILRRFSEGAGTEFTWHLAMYEEGFTGPGQFEVFGHKMPWIVGMHDGQFLAEIPVGTKAIIRGHPDAVAWTVERKDGKVPGQTWIPVPGEVGLGDAMVVEAKAFGDSYWETFTKKGVEAFPYYDLQTRLESFATGLPVAFVVAHKNADGTVDNSSEIVVQYIDPCTSISDVKIKVSRMVRMIEAEELPAECDWKMFPCPFWQELHDDAPTDKDDLGGIEITVEKLDELGALADLYEQYAAQEKQGKNQKRAHGKLIADIFDELGIKGKEITVTIPPAPGSTDAPRKVRLRDYIEEVAPQKITRAGYTLRYPKIKDIK